ncbi:MAG: response regulator [Xanthobacteraceae bacterium]|jgi:CheY-like chemotaxis protein
MARVLVIDDEVDVRATIKMILERRGHKVVLAECGNRALAITEVFAFDAVIVDIFVPGMDGFETIKLLRRWVPKVKIIAISGYVFRSSGMPTPDFLRMAVDLGAACCLQKPFRAGELVAAIEMPCGSLQSVRRSA